MEAEEHTPGPWTVVADDTVYAFPPSTDPDAIAAGYVNDAQLIAECSVMEDARLVASAPDLLAALERAVENADDEGGFRRGDVEWHEARAAIAKATGGTDA